MRTIAPNSIYRCYFDSACDGTEKGAAQGNDTLNVSKIHFDELAAAKAAHLAAKQVIMAARINAVAKPNV